MHIRYDLKNKIDLSQFKTQSSFFLQREDCVFSFYLNDFALSFDVKKNTTATDVQKFKVDFTISEVVENQSGDVFYKTISPHTDVRIKDIGFINDLFNGSDFSCLKASKEEVFEFIQFMINCMRKVKKLSSLA
jgi:uncharacterized protein YaaR (DUF327 family)